MCGILKEGSRGSIAFTSPGIQPKPSLTSCSSPREAMSCMPTQMPRNGLALRDDLLFERLPQARNGHQPVAAILEGADTGQHDAFGPAQRLGIGR